MNTHLSSPCSSRLRGESLLHGLALSCACTVATVMLITAGLWLAANDRLLQTLIGAGLIVALMGAAAAGLLSEWGETKGIVKR